MSMIKYRHKLLEFFPFMSIRPEQVRVLKWSADSSKRIVLLEAPTGSGKTMAALAGALVLTRKEKNARVIVFARTYTQINAYLKALSMIMKKNGMLPFTVLTGKKPLCKFGNELAYEQLINLPGFCNAIACPLYPERSRASIMSSEDEQRAYYQVLTQVSLLNITRIKEVVMEEFNACAFYHQKALLKDSKVILTTYPFLNYPFASVFDNMKMDWEKSVVIIDEAHNLLAPLLRHVSKETLRLLRVRGEMDFLEILKDERKRRELQEIVHDKIMKRVHANQPVLPGLIELYAFLDANETSVYFQEQGEYVMVNPEVSQQLEIVRSAKKMILMSATLQPFDLFARTLQITPYHASVTVSSQHRHEYVSVEEPFLTSQYSFRTRETYKRMGETIMRLKEASPRGALIVTPSYKFLGEISQYIKYDFIEQRDSTSQDILRVYQTNPKAMSLIVNGGKFTEGAEIVLPSGSAISLVIFAGIPYPPPGKITQIIFSSLTKKLGEEKAKELLYVITPSRLIKQAVGRATRKNGEKGVGVILDYRVTRLMKYLPVKRFKNKDKAKEFISRFFGRGITC